MRKMILFLLMALMIALPCRTAAASGNSTLIAPAPEANSTLVAGNDAGEEESKDEKKTLPDWVWLIVGVAGGGLMILGVYALRRRPVKKKS